MARQLVLAFGGRRNIKALDACITRLRVELHDPGRASEVRLKALGASGVVLVGSNVQAVFGPRSENLKTDMETSPQSAGAEADPADDAMPPAPGRLSVSGLEPSAPREPRLAGRSRAFVAALGGPANITAIDACALTRLRVAVADEGRVDEGGLRQAGVEALVRLPGNVLHLIVGPSADQYVTEMRAELQRSTG